MMFLFITKATAKLPQGRSTFLENMTVPQNYNCLKNMNVPTNFANVCVQAFTILPKYITVILRKLIMGCTQARRMHTSSVMALWPQMFCL